jgi:hypothetical protein
MFLIMPNFSQPTQKQSQPSEKEAEQEDQPTETESLKPSKQETYAVVGRKDNQFQFARYTGQIPPQVE